MNKAILVFDSYETLKKYYGKKVLITINIPVENKKRIKGYQYHSTEYAILKPVPKKLDATEIAIQLGKYEVSDKLVYQVEGYNQCIDRILSEEYND